MAAQERIIGGGFLIIGVAIVLVLLYFFTWGGTGPKEAYDEILATQFPAYEAALRDGDYLAAKDAAQAILDRMEEGGAATVRKHISAEATSGKGAGARLDKVVKSGALEKNVEGLYGLGDGWFTEKSHRAFGQLSEALETRLKIMRHIRATAVAAREALEDARIGSKMPLPLPPPKGLVKEDIPIVEPNPVYANDEELYRVFGLDAKLLIAALEVEDPGGKSTSARLRWNQKVVPSELKESVASIPESADTLVSIATQIDVSSKALADDPAAAAMLAALLKKGAIALGAELGDPHRAAFRENMGAFANGVNLVRALRAEATMLAPYLPTVRSLGAAFGVAFK